MSLKRDTRFPHSGIPFLFLDKCHYASQKIKWGCKRTGYVIRRNLFFISEGFWSTVWSTRVWKVGVVF